MNNKWGPVLIAGLILGSSDVWSQEDESADEAEITIRLMGAAEAELPNAVTNDIVLPASLAEDQAAVEKAKNGIDKANENRQRREQGLQSADEARQRGAEMAEEAQQNREARGRSDENRPDTPNGPPDNPGPPNR